MEIRYAKAAYKDRDTRTDRKTAAGRYKSHGGFFGLRLRVGGFRVIFRYDRDGLLEILQILNIDSRGGVYK